MIEKETLSLRNEMKSKRLTKQQYEALAGAVAQRETDLEDSKDQKGLALLLRAWMTVQDWYYEKEQ